MHENVYKAKQKVEKHFNEKVCLRNKYILICDMLPLLTKRSSY